MAGPLTELEQEEMFRAYCEYPCVLSVARACRRSHRTVLKYKRRNKWDERLKKVRQQTENKGNESIAEMLARQAKQARAIQVKALQKVVANGFKSPKDAADAYFKASADERVVRGEPSDRVEGSLLEEVRRRFADRRKEKSDA